MLNINAISRLAEKYSVPIEDVLFIALNVNGVYLDCDYNRMRTALHLADCSIFSYAKKRSEMDYYFALAINSASPFKLVDNILQLQDVVIGQTIGATEDICDSNYSRRNGTVLNINPNSRTSCRGCDFCYTAYQVPFDRKRLETEADLRNFFEDWMIKKNLQDLSHLIEVAVVTGCYRDSDNLCQFLITLKKVLSDYNFAGKIFYLGSQVNNESRLQSLVGIKPFGLCLSLETFERRHLLRDQKKAVSLKESCNLMDSARELGYDVNFSYIVGMESLDVLDYHFKIFQQHINTFPIINTLQLHKYHDCSLMDPSARRLEYFLEARKILERIFAPTDMRPLVWEDYRTLWFLTFNQELLNGIRTP